MTKARSLSDFIESDGSVTLVDNQKIKVGTGNDLQIYHDGSNSYIEDAGTGNLWFKSNGATIGFGNSDLSELFAVFNKDGASKLYFNNSTKLETTSSGINVTGHITASGTNNIYVGDNGKFVAGGEDDLQIYHDGTNSSIQNSTGDLFIYGGEDDIRIRAKNDEESIVANPNGGVYIYHDGSPKLATTSTGISVTGDIAVTGNVDGRDIATDGTKLDGIAAGATNVTNNNQLTNGAGYVTSSGNTIIGTDSDIDTSGATVVDQLNMTDGVIQSHSTRTMTLADLGYTGATNANYITNNNQLTNGAGYVTTDTNTTYTAGTGLNLSGTTFEISLNTGNALPNGAWVRTAEGRNRFHFSTNATTYFGTGSTYAFRNASDTDVFIIDGSGNGAFDGNVTAYYSDERLKDKQGKIENALDKVSKIETFYFKENELAKSLGHNNDKMQVGVSAQSVKAVLPEIVNLAPFDTNAETKESKSGEDYMTVDYAKLTPLLIEAIKELKDELKELKGV